MTTHKELTLDIMLAPGLDVPRGLRTKLQKAANYLHTHLPIKYQHSACANLLITSNDAVQKLNHDFRGINKPTNVLSFPSLGPQQIGKLGRSKQSVELGDIAIAYQYVVAESEKEHKILINHIIHLTIHGLLHLYGYDHIIMKQAEYMERLETRIMDALGLPDPYANDPIKEPKRVQTNARKR
jgi:rRNA maturation RNase YbeY